MNHVRRNYRTRSSQSQELKPSKGRVPPHDLDCEAAVLSAVMLEREALDRVIDILKPEHFYSDANRRIFEACVELIAMGTPVDIQTVASWLRSREWINQIGGPSYLVQLVDATPSVAHVAAHAKVIHEKWRLRQIIGTCQRIAAEGYGDVGTVQEFMDGAEQSIFAIARDGSAKKNEPQTVKSIFYNVIETIKDNADKKLLFSGLATGFGQLDEKLAGMQFGDLGIVAARPGMGKAQPLDAKILTPTGWRLMGDIAVGDQVIGSNGQPCNVTGVYEQGVLPVYSVTMDDGGTTRCCDDHLWYTRTRNNRKAKKPGTVKSLHEIRNSIQRTGGGLNHSLPYVGLVQFDEDKQLPLHPWILGVFLGDGSYPSGSVMIHNPEQDIRERFAALLSPDDMLVPFDDVSVRIRKRKHGNDKSDLGEALSRLGLYAKKSQGKFIPKEYLFASVEDRIKLLQGLCDTDGFVIEGGTGIEYTTTSQQLSQDIIFLVQSLGASVSCAEKQTHYTANGVRHECSLAYRMVFSFPMGNIIPITSKKHLAKWKHGSLRIQERFIRTVQSAGEAPCRCIMVDAPDHLYVTDDFIITHNTSFVLNVAVNVVAPYEMGDVAHGAVVFSLEMPREQLVGRMACSESGIDVTKIRRAHLLDVEDWRRLAETGASLSSGRVGWPLWIDDTPSITLLELRAKLRRIVSEYNRPKTDDNREQRVSLVIVDYLQLMKGSGNTDSREQEISEITRGLKELAKEFGVVVIALSQLNRVVETRGKDAKSKKPQLSDLRESGAIEQDADTIMFIWRESYYAPECENPHVAEVDVAKQRNGSTGVVYVKWTARCTRFDNLSPEEYPKESKA